MHAGSHTPEKTNRRGFSLIELALVLGISGLMLGFVLQSQQTAAVADCYAATKLQLRDIDGAIQRFARMNDRLPMPASRTVGVEGVTYGREASGGAIDSVAGTSWGALPFQALGLAPSYASDCWGNKLTYVVTTALTTNATSGGYLDTSVSGNITVRKDATTNSGTDTAYAVISHGVDGLGAVKNNYSNAAKGWCTGGATLTTQNCLANAAIVASATFNNGKDAGVAYFDDVVVSRGRPVPPTVSSPGNLLCWGTDFSGFGALADGSTVTGAGHVNLAPVASVSPEIFSALAEIAGNYHDNRHMCALKSDGAAYCWGSNSNGQLGDGTTTNRAVPTAVSTAIRFAKLYVFGNITCGLQRNPDGSLEGTPYCWGENTNGTGVQRTTPQALAVGGAKFTMMTGGIARFSNPIHCGLATNGDAYCWAQNFRGDGTNTSTLLPGLVAGGRKFADLLAGSPTCGITSAADPGGAGAVYCWGDLGAGSNNTTAAPFFPPIDISGATNGNPVVVSTSTNHGMAAGDRYTIRFVNGMGYLNERGTAFCTGVGAPISTCTAANTIARVFNGSNNSAAFFTVTSGNFTANTVTIVGLDGTGLGTYTSGGQILVYSANAPRLMNQSGASFSRFVRTKADATAAGFSALSTTGQLYHWGSNGNNQFGNPVFSTSLPQLSASGSPNLTKSNPMIANVNAHGYSPGDFVYFRGGICYPQMVEGVYRVGSVPNANQFTLQDMNGININSTSFTGSSCTGTRFTRIASGVCYFDRNTSLGACIQLPSRPLGLCTAEAGAQCTFTSPDKVAFGTSAAAVTNANTNLGWMDYAGDNTATTRTSPVLMRTSTNALLPFTFSQFLPLEINSTSVPGMCGISSTNDAYCWGSVNTGGVYGFGDTSNSTYPRAISGGLKFGSITKIATTTSAPHYGAVCGLKFVCTADGAPSGGNPANCCNGDSDGNGTCGTQAATACTPAEEALFYSVCTPGSSSTVTDSTIISVSSCYSCGGGRFRAVCNYDHSHSEYGAWEEDDISETNMYYDGVSVTNGSYCSVETRSVGHPSGAGITNDGTCPFVQAACP